MSFITDKQTLADFGLFATGGRQSIFTIFNKTRTRGGAELLEEMLHNPLSDVEKINHRAAIIAYFRDAHTVFPFDGVALDAAADYLGNHDERSRLSVEKRGAEQHLEKLFGVDNHVQQVTVGVKAVLTTLQRFRDFIGRLSIDSLYWSELRGIAVTLDGLPETAVSPVKLAYEEVVMFDNMLRFKKRSDVLAVFQHIYLLDVWVSVAQLARDRGFALPAALNHVKEDDSQAMTLEIEGAYHPFLENAKANSLYMDGTDNVLFLTGANMAGKSTFMKSVGIVMYLAHVGFPVPATSMRFSVFDGLLSSINLSDNLNMGYSHFLAEVKRVKKVAQTIAQGKKLFVLFDELFRGTNVKDAYEGTVALTGAFARQKGSRFVISTHIIEAGEELKRTAGGILYRYLPTRMEGNHPVYTYRLEEGITEDRHGMVIINNEGILELLDAPQADTPISKMPGFQTDAQTQKDLNLLGKYDPQSVFSLFNHTQTQGGERLLEKWFHKPLIEQTAMEERSKLFQYFGTHGQPLPVGREELTTLENYLGSGKSAGKLSTALAVLSKKVMAGVVNDTKYRELADLVTTSVRVLAVLQGYIADQLRTMTEADCTYYPHLVEMKTILEALDVTRFEQIAGNRSTGWSRLYQMDHMIRSRTDRLLDLLQRVYELDVYVNIGRWAKKKGFGYATTHAKEENILVMQGVRHPKLDKAVSNDVVLKGESNLFFLTGANMAGKSTLMKAVSINLYLAHMGFPVAVSSMAFSIREGLYTSINVSDNLMQGLSHYYAEVKRVKTVAEAVSKGQYLFVIFDELFKGTNVKDAFDATLAVTESFARYKRSFFVISTHIIEVGDALRQHRDDVQFWFLPTVVVDDTPRYTYQLKTGITDDRQGMMIIRKERILESLAAPRFSWSKPI